ncbi:MAG TPA: hypothetical protein VH120_16385 [Gemmataceae bacterium]|nr:hypothetical protein [Gemmataceae bacterium]
MRQFAMALAAVIGVVASTDAADRIKANATAEAGRSAGQRADPVLRLAVWSAVQDVRQAGGTAQDITNAVADAMAWWQSNQPSLTSEDWLLVDVARIAAREVIRSGGSTSDLFTALDQVLTWWQGVEPTLPANEDRLFRFVVGLTLEAVEQKGGTLQDALTAVNGVLSALDETTGTSGSGGTGSTGTGSQSATSGPTTSGSAHGPTTGTTASPSLRRVGGS